jgi:regulatory protein
MAARPPLTLKARALQWLSQREHSRVELRRKLMRAARARDAAADHNDTADAAPEVEALLDWLVAHRWLSETRFVESRVHARQARFGARRIEQELRQHGTTLDAETAGRLRESEFERARQVWARKFGTAAADSAERARQMRFLAGRGFSGEAIRRVVRDADPD